MYPAEKNLRLLFERLDKNEDTRVDLDEFQVAITPFLQGLNNEKWHLIFIHFNFTPAN